MSILFRYKITLREIAEKINSKIEGEIFTIYSPDCFHQLDIFVKTNTGITIPPKLQSFLTEENKYDILLEDVILHYLLDEKNNLLFGVLKHQRNKLYQKGE